jgi:Tol biopolymer transport system component
LGPPVPAIHGIDHYFRHANAAISDSGTLAFLPADAVRQPELFWLDRAGHTTPVPGGQGSFVGCALSPDDKGAACERVDGAMTGVWVLDLERGTTRLLVSHSSGDSPIWSRDGRFITYARHSGAKFALCRKRADGTVSRKPLSRIVPDIRLPKTGRRTADRCCSPSTPVAAMQTSGFTQVGR